MPHLKGSNGEDICACTVADWTGHHGYAALSPEYEQRRERVAHRAQDFERMMAAGVPLRHLVPRRTGFLGWLHERWTDVVQVWRDGHLS